MISLQEIKELMDERQSRELALQQRLDAIKRKTIKLSEGKKGKGLEQVQINGIIQQIIEVTSEAIKDQAIKDKNWIGFSITYHVRGNEYYEIWTSMKTNGQLIVRSCNFDDVSFFNEKLVHSIPDKVLETFEKQGFIIKPNSPGFASPSINWQG